MVNFETLPLSPFGSPRRKWSAVYDDYKPHILKTFDDAEYNAAIVAEKILGELFSLFIQKIESYQASPRIKRPPILWLGQN